MGYVAYMISVVVFTLMQTRLAESTLPSFDTVKGNYPTYSQHTDQEFLQLAKLPSIIAGPTDAMRVSHALVESGYTFLINPTQYGWSRTSSVNCKKYISRAETMKQYLTAKVGRPFTSANVNEYQGKKGVIVFQNCGNLQSPNEHVDLYDGTTCKTKCLFQQCTSNQLFEFTQ